MTDPASAKPFNLYEDGFEDDRFGRRTAGERLSAVLDLSNSPLVIALHGAWGTGKTHFLQRWVGAHAQGDRTATTLYFDAFASDYQSDPLVALVAALAGRLPQSDKSKVDWLKAAALKCAKPATRIGLKLLTAGISEAVSDIGDAIVEAGSAEAEKALEAYWAREEGRTQAMAQFRAALGELTGTDENPTPLVIVIDELDRCRPDYALELLEVIKHFFDVPRVHFVLGVNLAALENSVRARYGAGIEAEEYLQKFISFRVTLPAVTGRDNAPIVLEYAKALVREMGLSQKWQESILSSLTVASRGNALTMRDVDKILAQMTLLPAMRPDQNWREGWVYTACELLVMKVARPDLYEAASQGRINLDQMAEYLDSTTITRTEPTDQRKNPSYDQRSTWHFEMWKFLLGLAAPDGVWFRDISRSFGGQSERDPRVIPQTISRDWLEVLTLA